MKKITIFCSMNRFFWIRDSTNILILRNQFRIIGSLLKIPIVNSKINFFLFLSLEEVLIGLELGFLKVKIFNEKKKDLYAFLIKNLGKKHYTQYLLANHKAKKKRACAVRKWRETVDILTKVCLFKFKQKTNSRKKKGYVCELVRLNKNKDTKEFDPLHFQNLLKNFSENDFLKYTTFKNLWQKGFYLTCGIKFGGSFLVYAGNIVDVHSYISILTIPFNFNLISPKLIIASGRTGTMTKKFTILVNLDRSCSVKFGSLRWHNFLP